MRSKNEWSRWLILILFFAAGCYPQGPDFTEDLDVVLTNHNPNYNFKSKTKYAIPTQIVKITGDVVTGDPAQFVPDAIAQPMLARMKSNMAALGYTEVAIGANPDLILLPAAMETTTITYWYDYWWWYYGYGWGYPWYPWYGGGYYTSYTTGTLTMNLIDPTQQAGDGNPVGQWLGAANGILTNTFDANRVGKAIDQAFAQSPYLKH